MLPISEPAKTSACRGLTRTTSSIAAGSRSVIACPVEQHLAFVGIEAATHAVDQGGRVGRVGRDDRDELAVANLQRQVVQRCVADASERETNIARTARLSSTTVDVVRRFEHGADSLRGRSDHCERCGRGREARPRPDEELRQPDGGDQLTDANRAGVCETCTDQRDHGEEQAVQQCRGSVDAGRGSAHPNRRVTQCLAGADVLGRGGLLGADALDGAQRGDQIGGDRGSFGRAALLVLAALLDPVADELGEPQQQCRTGDHQQAEHERDREHGDAGNEQRGERRHDRGRDGDRSCRGVRVGRGDRQQLAAMPRRPADATSIDDAACHVHPEVVIDAEHGRLVEPRAEAPRQRQEREVDDEDRGPHRHLRTVARGDRPVDRRADDDRYEGLADLVADGQQRRDDRCPPPYAHRLAHEGRDQHAATVGDRMSILTRRDSDSVPVDV